MRRGGLAKRYGRARGPTPNQRVMLATSLVVAGTGMGLAVAAAGAPLAAPFIGMGMALPALLIARGFKEDE